MAKTMKEINEKLKEMVDNYLSNVEDCGKEKEDFLKHYDNLSCCFTETGYDIEQEFTQDDIDFYWSETFRSLQSVYEHLIADTLIANYK